MQENEQVSFDKDDDFDRKPVAEKMIKLLLSKVDVSPMLIDGKWGTGKTTFCKKSIALLKKIIDEEKKSIKCAYVDAFTADHANEPLITIIAAISKLINTSQQKTKFLNTTKGIIRFALKTALKAGTALVFKANNEELVQELSDTLKNSSDDGIKSAIDSLIKDHQEIEDNISKLKKALAEITKEQELIIFIDELDRCRPDFAVALIECIKHIFETPGIQFVLLANFEQLESGIKHCYDKDIDAKLYLDKFLKFHFTLPHQASHYGKKDLASVIHAQMLIQKSLVLKQSNLLNYRQYNLFLKELIEHNTLSLRQVETFIRYIEIHYTLSAEGIKTYGNTFVLLYLLVIYIFVFRKDIFYKIITKKISSAELSSLVGITTEQISSETERAAFSISKLIHLAFRPPDKQITQAEQELLDSQLNQFFNSSNTLDNLYSFFINEFQKLQLQF